MPRSKTASPLRIFIIAAEASGDLLGASLMASLNKKREVVFSGCGGKAMKSQGLKAILGIEDFSLIGITQALKALPRLFRQIALLRDKAVLFNPDLVIIIDAPDLAKRFCKILPEDFTPRFVQLGLPTVWFWRPERVAFFTRQFDLLLALFPFEANLFTPGKARTVFIGHPLFNNSALTDADAKAFRKKERFSESQLLFCLLPGSRQSEIKNSAPFLKKAAEEISKLRPDLTFIIPVAPNMEKPVRQLFSSLEERVRFVVQGENIYAAMKSCRAGLAVSGTVSLEMAILGLPHAICYRENWLNAQIATARGAFKLSPYVSIINYMAGKSLIPEFIQQNCRPHLLIKAGLDLLDSEKAEAQKQGVAKVLAQMMPAGGRASSDIAAEEILKLCSRSAIEKRTES